MRFYILLYLTVFFQFLCGETNHVRLEIKFKTLLSTYEETLVDHRSPSERQKLYLSTLELGFSELKEDLYQKKIDEVFIKRANNLEKLLQLLKKTKTDLPSGKLELAYMSDLLGEVVRATLFFPEKIKKDFRIIYILKENEDIPDLTEPEAGYVYCFFDIPYFSLFEKYWEEFSHTIEDAFPMKIDESYLLSHLNNQVGVYLLQTTEYLFAAGGFWGQVSDAKKISTNAYRPNALLPETPILALVDGELQKEELAHYPNLKTVTVSDTTSLQQQHFSRLIKFFKEHRIPAAPKEFIYFANHKKDPTRKFYLKNISRQNKERKAEIHAKLKKGDLLELNVENIDSFELNFRNPVFLKNHGKRLAISVNGVRVFDEVITYRNSVIFRSLGLQYVFK